MAIFRNVQISFWTDAKVVDEFTPEDKYFYLYLFTNPHTNLCGCYEISKSQMSIELGYTKEVIDRLIDRFSKVHKVAVYEFNTKEMLLLNWHKYNWTKSDKLRIALQKEIESVKSDDFREYLVGIFNGSDTVSIPYLYGMDTTDTDTVTNTITITKNIDKINYLKIIDLYHANCPSLPKVTKITDARKKLINARLKDYSEDDLEKAFKEAEASDFLTGRNGKWGGASFDWIMNTNNIVKILEGNYKNKPEKRIGFNANQGIISSGYDFAALEAEVKNRGQT